MNELIDHMLTVFLGYFAIMNPIANTAVFIGLTAEETKEEQSRIAQRALLISFFIVLAFAVLGKTIFHLFGITLPALRITGGILVFLVGYNMLQGHRSNLQKSHEESDVDISISPLAMPVLAGPGTIATTMNFAAKAGWSETIITVGMFALLCLITLLFFKYSEKTVAFFGRRGLKIVTRLMGLILAVMGTQMLISGVWGAIDAHAR